MSKYNFFDKVLVTTTSFEDCVVSWNFISAGFSLLNESTTPGRIIEYSFMSNGTVHGDLDPSLPSAGVAYDNRHESVIYFRLKTDGAPVTVRVEAWA